MSWIKVGVVQSVAGLQDQGRIRQWMRAVSSCMLCGCEQRDAHLCGCGCGRAGLSACTLVRNEPTVRLPQAPVQHNNVIMRFSEYGKGILEGILY